MCLYHICTHRGRPNKLQSLEPPDKIFYIFLYYICTQYHEILIFGEMLDIAVNRKSCTKEKHICVFQFPHHTHITQITHARFSVEETRKSPPPPTSPPNLNPPPSGAGDPLGVWERGRKGGRKEEDKRTVLEGGDKYEPFNWRLYIREHPCPL